ncbi:MAG: hypothetical protein GYA51_16775 [Candidatus Methanofastidiosa archaeon]|nr:hypothetical protein [Candidatus Methanofastidiosa archaeon]
MCVLSKIFGLIILIIIVSTIYLFFVGNLVPKWSVKEETFVAAGDTKIFTFDLDMREYLEIEYEASSLLEIRLMDQKNYEIRQQDGFYEYDELPSLSSDGKISWHPEHGGKWYLVLFNRTDRYADIKLNVKIMKE